MPQPQVVSHIRHGMAERYEVVIDFSKYTAGQRVVLRNEQRAPKNNIDYANTDKVMAFDVVGRRRRAPRTTRSPTILNPDMPGHEAARTRDAVKTRQFVFERKNASWTINGTTWDDVVDSDYQRTLADPELGDDRDLGAREQVGRLVPPGPHPPHRLQDPRPQRQAAAALRVGPKDVVYVGENETVRVVMTFGPHDRAST